MSHAQLGPPPVISVQPVDRTVLVGATVAFTVTVKPSLTPISYQWRFHPETNSQGDEDIPNAGGTILLPLTDTTLTFYRSNVDAASVGEYQVRLKNGSGTVDSSRAALNIVDVPLKFDLAQKATNGFKLRLKGISAPSYVIEASPDGLTWMPISTNGAATGIVNHTDTAGTNRGVRFYRARIQ